MSTITRNASLYFDSSDRLDSKALLEQKSLLEWTKDDILHWIESLVFENGTDLDSTALKQDMLNRFEDHNITGDAIRYLSNELLQEMGFKELRTRLIIKQKIDQLLFQNSIVNRDLYTDLQVDSSALITSISLLESVMTNFKTQNGEEYRKLNEQFSKLRSDLLPAFKWIKDHKPLPTPEISKLGNSYWGSQPNSASSPTKNSARTSQATSPIVQDHHSSPPALNSTLSLNNSNNARSVSSSRRKSLLSPAERSSFLSPTANTASLTSPTTSTLMTGSSTTTLPTTTSISNIAAVANSGNVSASSSRPSLNHSSSQQSMARPQLNPSGSSEPLKQLRAKTEDSCYKILQHAMRRHGIANEDWRKYALVICYGDQERVLELEEKPVVVFRELQEQGQHPAIMLRQIDYNDDDEATINATPGGRI